jgi:hypothetical protein
MQISEAMDIRTKQGLLNALVGKAGKRMDTLLVPLELLCCVARTEFSDKKAFIRWQKRQVVKSVLDFLLSPYTLLACNSVDGKMRMLLSYIFVLFVDIWIYLSMQLKVLEEGLVNHPVVGFGESGRKTNELRILLAKIEESEV